MVLDVPNTVWTLAPAELSAFLAGPRECLDAVSAHLTQHPAPGGWYHHDTLRFGSGSALGPALSQVHNVWAPAPSMVCRVWGLLPSALSDTDTAILRPCFTAQSWTWLRPRSAMMSGMIANFPLVPTFRFPTLGGGET